MASVRPFASRDDVSKYYDILNELGSGTFSVVKLAVHKKTGKQYALKIIDKKDVGDKTEMIQTEVEILRQIQHPNIIGLKEIFETPTHLYLVMELVTGGELFDKIVERGAYSERDASKLIGEILRAVDYLHSKNIVHRDLKPENLLYESDEPNALIKLADFGLSKVVGSEAMLKTACGTPGYVAPEVLKCEGYEKAVDLWSVGVIMYILLCGFPPFYEENTAKLFEQIMEGRFDFPDPYWTDISDSAKDLICHLLVVNPAERYTAKQALKHPWISGAAAPERVMPNIIDQIRKFNAKRKFKTAILATIAARRLAS